MAASVSRGRSLLTSAARLLDNFGQSATCKLQHNQRFTSSSTSHEYDVIIVGGGIVGMATARELKMRHPQLSFAVVEKENGLAVHQSGNNSGVIHAGIYYTPGSLKAKLCVEGMDLAYKYCDEHNVPYKKVGKLIVAVEPEEVPRLDKLFERGVENGVKDLRVVGPDEIKEIEPNCVGFKAIHSPHTGIIDWGVVTRDFGKTFEKLGGRIYTNYEVTKFDVTKESTEGSKSGIQYPVSISGKKSQNPELRCKYIVTCGGLQADKLAEKSGSNREPRIVPFRGEYLELIPEKCNLVRGNIYPVPNPALPFLGVHFTPRMDGSVWLGPNAVLAFKREGYKMTDVNIPELVDAVTFRGFRKLAMKHFSYGTKEMYRSIFHKAQFKLLQRFVPSLQFSDVQRGPAGVRAQALDRDGNLVDDFVFDSGEGELARHILHVRNAPSPAATSSLAIAKMVADKCKETFQL